jgi:hypothetical protein
MKLQVDLQRIEERILLVRGHKAMLDADIARLYGVAVGRLNEAVSRNRNRFPPDFMFQLTKEEFNQLKKQAGTGNLKSQIAISSSGWGGRRTRPYAFTKHGVAMLSSVLRSPRAIQVNIAIMRAFVRLRQTLALHTELASRLAELERKTDDYRVYHEAAGRFHDAIFVLSGNQRLRTMYQSLTYQVTRFRSLSLAVGQRPKVSVREHRRLAAAIVGGRAGEAERLMRAHIEGAQAVLRQRVAPAPGTARPGCGTRNRSTSRRRG